LAASALVFDQPNQAVADTTVDNHSIGSLKIADGCFKKIATNRIRRTSVEA
jgi:hypothetical protein